MVPRANWKGFLKLSLVARGVVTVQANATGGVIGADFVT
jgi:non-homologous end joining protein Ku